MRRADSAALRLDAPAVVLPRGSRANFTAIEGESLDANARQGVRPLFMRIVSCLVAVALVAFAFGGTAVWLTSGTVAILQQNNALSSQIKDTRNLNDDLRIECSLLSRSERISQIATQNLGMVYASTADRVSVD
ncbi:MAG: cell division protein FtsL [Atopobiaceae bacterium]|nr:cell division protein FtsL [Atopobiaceae bacterium]